MSTPSLDWNNIASWSDTQKAFVSANYYTEEHLGPELRAQWAALTDGVTLTILALSLPFVLLGGPPMWVLVGIGGVGTAAATIAFQAAAFWEKATAARSEKDLRDAAQHLASIVTAVGVAALTVAIPIMSARAAGYARALWAGRAGRATAGARVAAPQSGVAATALHQSAPRQVFEIFDRARATSLAQNADGYARQAAWAKTINSDARVVANNASGTGVYVAPVVRGPGNELWVIDPKRFPDGPRTVSDWADALNTSAPVIQDARGIALLPTAHKRPAPPNLFAKSAD